MKKNLVAFLAIAAMLTLGAGNVLAENKVVGDTPYNIVVGPLGQSFNINGQAIADIERGQEPGAGNSQLNGWDRNVAVGELPGDFGGNGTVANDLNGFTRKGPDGKVAYHRELSDLHNNIAVGPLDEGMGSAF